MVHLRRQTLAAHWRERAKVRQDVVFFHYAKTAVQAAAEEVYVWDLDKTYLDSSWGSIKELLKTALEKAFQKRNVPGALSLVRALRISWQHRAQRRDFPIYFITASPPQMEERIREKLEFDQILPIGIYYKDNLRNLKPSRFRRLTQQVGFKLQALLQLRTQLRADVRQVLWGDDSESDAVIYSLYSDICARRFNEKDLLYVLRSLNVVGEQTDEILELQSEIPPRDPVEKIYINLAVDTDPDYYLKFGRRLVPTHNSFQAALDLMQDGRLSTDQVVKIAQDLTLNYGFSTDELELSLDNLIRRQILSAETLSAILPVLQAPGLISRDFQPTVQAKSVVTQDGGRVFQLEGVIEPWVPEHIDYLHDFR